MKIALAESPYESVQGEGMFTGVFSAFIRWTGCNLRCSWCDSGYTSWKPEHKHMEAADLFVWLQGIKAEHVVLTGGEPTLYPEQLKAVIAECVKLGKTVTIETNGTKWNPSVQPHLWSVSPKLSSSYPKDGPEKAIHERGNDLTNLHRFKYVDMKMLTLVQYKFVVTQFSDLEEIATLCDLYEIAPHTVWLMPEGITANEVNAKSAQVVEWAKERGYNFSTRLHVLIYGPRRGV